MRFQRLKAQLFRGNAELHQLGLVHSDRVVVGLRCMIDRVLEVLNHLVLRLDRLFYFCRQLLVDCRVHVRAVYDLLQLDVLLLQLLIHIQQALAQDDVLQVCVSLHFLRDPLELPFQLLLLQH